MSANHF